MAQAISIWASQNLFLLAVLLPGDLSLPLSLPMEVLLLRSPSPILAKKKKNSFSILSSPAVDFALSSFHPLIP